MELLQWYNLVFVLPILAAVLYIGLLASGLGSGGEGELDVDHDADLGHDFDAAHAHPEAGAHLLGAVLGLLGVGKVPLSILLMSLFLVWGGAGLVFKAVFGAAAMH